MFSDRKGCYFCKTAEKLCKGNSLDIDNAFRSSSAVWDKRRIVYAVSVFRAVILWHTNRLCEEDISMTGSAVVVCHLSRLAFSQHWTFQRVSPPETVLIFDRYLSAKPQLLILFWEHFHLDLWAWVSGSSNHYWGYHQNSRLLGIYTWYIIQLQYRVNIYIINEHFLMSH